MNRDFEVFYADKILYVYVILSFSSLAKDVGMRIGQPCPLKNLSSNAIEEITNYFSLNKALKLIIVIIPDKSNVTYGECIILVAFLNVYMSEIVSIVSIETYRQSKTDHRTESRHTHAMREIANCIEKQFFYVEKYSSQDKFQVEWH
jgi:hypothetical protein